MIRKIRSLVVGLILLALGAGDAALAQRSWDYAWGYSSTLQYYANKAALRRKKGGKKSRGKTTRPRRVPKREPYNPYPNLGKTTFTPHGDRNFRIWLMAANAAKGIDWTEYGAETWYEATKKSNALNKELMAIFQQCLDTYNREAAASGVPRNDVARTMARCIALNYRLVAGKVPTSKAQAALYVQIREAMEADPRFQKMADHAKQDIHEALVVSTMWPQLEARGILKTGGEAAKDVSARMARRSLLAITGIPLEKMRLDDEGLSIKG